MIMLYRLLIACMVSINWVCSQWCMSQNCTVCAISAVVRVHINPAATHKYIQLVNRKAS